MKCITCGAEMEFESEDDINEYLFICSNATCLTSCTTYEDGRELNWNEDEWGDGT